MALVAHILPQHLSADDLAALSAEIAALARAGVPLDAGLIEVGEDFPGALGRAAQQLGQQLQAGGALEQVVAAPGGPFPPVFQAVVRAGVRAGRLPAALEGLAHIARRTAEMRRQLGLALLYPLLVVLISYGMLAGWVRGLTPKVAASLEEWGAAPGLSPRAWEDGALIAGAVLTCLLAGLLLAWVVSRFTLEPSALLDLFSLGLFGRLSRLRRLGVSATCCDLLALFLEHQTPLDEALPLAAQASGDPRFARRAAEYAQALARGAQAPAPAGFPQSLGWLLSQDTQRAGLPNLLRQAAANAREEASLLARWLTQLYPALLTLLVGATLAVAFITVVVWPWAALVSELTAMDR